MQINDSGLLVTLEIAYLICFPFSLAPRCRRNVGLFYRWFLLVYVHLNHCWLEFANWNNKTPKCVHVGCWPSSLVCRWRKLICRNQVGPVDWLVGYCCCMELEDAMYLCTWVVWNSKHLRVFQCTYIMIPGKLWTRHKVSRRQKNTSRNLRK